MLVAREPDGLVAERGRPRMSVSDNSSEFTSNAILAWADQSRVEWHYLAPGKPMQNAFIDSFNGRLRGRTAQRDPVHLAGSGSRGNRPLACQL